MSMIASFTFATMLSSFTFATSHDERDEHDTLLMLQLSNYSVAVQSTAQRHGDIHGARQSLPFESLLDSAGNVRSTCTNLVNRGTHFTVDIEVGTPGQKFSVVADTGSNSLIVPSCECVRTRYCSSDARCFTGTDKSSSFILEKNNETGEPDPVQLTFGSGIIQAVAAKDVVTIGKLKLRLDDGLLLMTKRLLRISVPFEGILGLGLPNGSVAMHEAQTRAKASRSSSSRGRVRQYMDKILKRFLKKVLGGSAGGGIRIMPRKVLGGAASGGIRIMPGGAESLHTNNIADIRPENLVVNPEKVGADDQEDPNSAEMPKKMAPAPPKGLLEQAGIERFSMCFNDGTDGVLQIGSPRVKTSLGNIGKFHWGLDMQGLTVGNQTAMLSFCSKENMTKGQVSACAAIPDSGTTVMMGPRDQIGMLFESICDNWPRCRDNHTHLATAAEKAKKAVIKEYGVDPWNHSAPSKASVMSLLLLDCDRWLKGSNGLEELPPLHFHVAGSDGTKQALKIPGRGYILESVGRLAHETHKHLHGILHRDTLKKATKHKKICSPAFGSMTYTTKKNGPVWILGTPLFYEFHVGYDLNSKPPSMSFVSTREKPCTSCGGKASLLGQQGRQSAAQPERRRPRWVSGPLRLPNIDFDQPL